MKAVFRLKPLDKAPLPPNPLRRLCHRLAYHPWFDNAMTAVICANIALLATTYYGEPERFATGEYWGQRAGRLRSRLPPSCSWSTNGSCSTLLWGK